MAIDIYKAMDERFFGEEQLHKLNQPLQTTRIKERKGFGGKLLKYLKADDVIGVANEIFGYGRWGYKVVARDHTVVEDPKKGGPIHMYTADIELSVVGCPFTFPGDGVGVVNDPYTVEMHEKARKEATSDALKRALRHYGDQFGLCLYDQEDMVDAGNGVLVPVKDAKPAQKPQPKRVVESEKPVLPDDIKKRLNDLFPQAKVLKLFASEKNPDASLANFFKLLSELAGGPTITSPTQVTMAHIKALEIRINLEEQEALEEAAQATA